VTKQQYIQYLIATNTNYTCTNLSDHLDSSFGTSHDAISDYLLREKLTPRGLWELVAPLIVNAPSGYLIVDDGVQNKQYSKSVELVKLQYSGAEAAWSVALPLSICCIRAAWTATAFLWIIVFMMIRPTESPKMTTSAKCSFVPCTTSESRHARCFLMAGALQWRI
jgi:hypothetical protein